MGCNHDCSRCGGCAGVLELTEEEIGFLMELAQFAFLPVSRRADDMTPHYLEDERHSPETYSLILQVLEQKRLVSLDYDQPLSNTVCPTYAAFPVKGSVALTERGQNVVKMLEIQGLI